MDKAEQPTIAQARYTVADYELAEQCVSAANVVTCDGYYEVDIEKVAETLAKARTTSLAAQEALAGYRAAVSFISADSWDGCSDCINILIAARCADMTDAMTINETAEHLKRIRLHYDPAALPPAPSLAAQDGLVEALDDATIDQIILNFAGGVVQVPSEHNPRGYVSYYRPREAMRKALSAIKEQHHD